MADAVLVIGGTGKVGREVAKQLAEKGVPTLVGTRNPAKAVVPEGTQAVAFDFDDPATWDAALAGADRIFLIGPEGEANPDQALAPLVEKVKAAGIQRIAFMTALGVDTYDGPFGRAEKMVAASGIPSTFLRPNWFMQNFHLGMFMDSIKHAGGIFIPAADAKVSFVDTRDIAAMAVAALTEDGHDGKGYNITGGRSLDHTEVMALLSDAAGKTFSYTAISDDDMRASLAEQQVPPPMIELYSELFAAMREGATSPVSSDVPDVLGREPRTIEAYAKEYADHWR